MNARFATISFSGIATITDASTTVDHLNAVQCHAENPEMNEIAGVSIRDIYFVDYATIVDYLTTRNVIIL